jgi:protein translocase SecG subunit
MTFTIIKFLKILWKFFSVSTLILILLQNPKNRGGGGSGIDVQLTQSVGGSKTLITLTWVSVIIFVALNVILSLTSTSYYF